MGGTGRLALVGVKELWQECEAELAHFDEIWLSVGSGGLLAGTSHALSDWKGTIKAVYPFKKLHSIWPGKEWMHPSCDIEHIACYLGQKFGAFDDRIVSFINRFYDEHQIWLDPIYTARSMMNLYERINAGQIKLGAKILFYHSGGLSGITGYNHQYGCTIPYSAL
jgi:1-aminocyclopropane-1-carboxylate deaminase